MYRYIIIIILFFTLTVSGQITTPISGGSGGADSIGVDINDGNGFNAYLYPAFLREGANATFTISGDTLTIQGSAASGTADSMGVDTNGDGTIDAYLYSTTAGAFHVKQGTGITLTVAGDTVTVANSFGATIDTTSSEIIQAQWIEFVQDRAGGMFSGNTETRITVTYNEDGTTDFVVDDMNDDIPEAGDYTNLTGGNGIDHSVTGTIRIDTANAITNGSSLAVSSNQVYDFCETTQNYLLTSENSDWNWADSSSYGPDSVLYSLRADSAYSVTDGGIDTVDFARTQFDELVADLAGAMVSGNTETNITVTYQDTDNTIDFEVGSLGEVNTLADTGTFDNITGFGLAGGKTGTALKVKGLIEGANITITASGDSAYSIAGPAGSGTADSLGVDTNGDGTIDNYLYSTTAGAFHIKKGANITLTVDTDTLTIAGPVASGTADSIGIDTSGAGDYAVLYSTAGRSATFREGAGIDFTVDTDTAYIASTLGTTIVTGEITDGTILEPDLNESSGSPADNDILTYNSASSNFTWVTSLPDANVDNNITITGLSDSTNWNTAYDWGNHSGLYVAKDDSGSWDEITANIMLNAAKIGNAADSGVADSSIATRGYVTGQGYITGNETITLSGDATGSGATAITVNVLYADSAGKDGSGNTITSTYETISNVALIGDDTTNYQTAYTHSQDNTQAHSDYMLNASDTVSGTYNFTDGEIDSVNHIDADTVTADERLIMGNADIAEAELEILDGATVTTTELNYVSGVTSAIQTQLDGKEGTLTNSAGLAAALSDETGTGAVVFGTSPSFTTSINIPNGATPTTDAEGEIAWDSDDDAIEVYSGDEAESVLLPIYRTISLLISQPDSLQAYSDSVCIFHADSLLFPAGVEIDQVSITLEADAAYSLVLQEWSGADPPAYQNVMTTIATTASDSYAEEAPDTDGNLDADDRIYMVLPTTDVPSLFINIIYHVTAN